MELGKIFDEMKSQIGGEKNESIQWYLKRPRSISRKSFFEAAVWAIWSAGKSYQATEKFLEHAEAVGFDWDYNTFGSWDDDHLKRFIEKLHGRPVNKSSQVYKRWRAVHSIARMLKDCQNDEAFCRDFFNGKTKSADLDRSDVENLIKRRLPWIGKANAHFILRNMGGEFIKCDRWVQAFLEHYKISQEDLEKKLKELNIPLGLFDVVLWDYCSGFIKATEKFNEYFKQNFP